MKTDKPVQKVRYDYFIQKKKRIIKAFNKFCLKVEKELTLAYDKDFADKIIPQAKEEFEDLIPRIPYFGGLINPFNELIMVGAYMVAVHKAMKSHGKTAEETVLIFYDLVDHLFTRIPKFFLWLGQKFVFSNTFIKMLQGISKRMSEMKDPNGFDFYYCKDDGKEHDWHFVAKQCGIVTFFKQEGCQGLAPYCNFVDVIQGKALNMGVYCKTCLGAGDDTCEEYMKQGRETIMPENVKRLLQNREVLLLNKEKIP